MIRAALFDLGDTLVAGDAVLPGAVAALTAIAALETGAGPLRLALVSDWEDLGPAPSPAEIAQSVARYVALVDRVGLLPFFSPPEQCMTLSMEIGTRKPDRRIFERSLARLGLPVELDGALFITENADHVEAAQALGMTALRFGPDGDFASWDEAAALVGNLLGVSHATAAQTDAAAHERMLRANERVVPPGAALGPGETHSEAPDGGPPRRGRFSTR